MNNDVQPLFSTPVLTQALVAFDSGVQGGREPETAFYKGLCILACGMIRQELSARNQPKPK